MWWHIVLEIIQTILSKSQSLYSLSEGSERPKNFSRLTAKSPLFSSPKENQLKARVCEKEEILDQNNYIKLRTDKEAGNFSPIGTILDERTLKNQLILNKNQQDSERELPNNNKMKTESNRKVQKHSGTW